MKAFVLRMRPGDPALGKRKDRLPEGLASNEIIIGWSEAPELLDNSIRETSEFTKIILSKYPGYEGNASSAGSGAGSMWRFIREMNEGDLVIVPDGDNVFVARVHGPVRWLSYMVEVDTAFRRSVIWLNDKRPFPRGKASAILQKRLKNRGTCFNATDLLADVEALIR